MSLDTTATAKRLADEYVPYSATNPHNPGRTYLDFLQTVLDEDFQKAVTSYVNFLITPPAGSLYIPDTTPYEMPENIGQACADYWVKAIDLGSPESCDEVKTVVNDAAKIAAPIAANLRAIGGKTADSNPPYWEFVEAIYKEVRTILWDIHEEDSTCSEDFVGVVT